MNLLNCYIPVFSLIIKLEAYNDNFNDYDYFRTMIVNEINNAVQCAENIDVTTKQRDYALYAVVTMIDEKILCSKVSFRNQWRDNLLQLNFFGSSIGGEEFFNRLESLVQEEECEAIWVFYLCLLLGFKGKYIDDEHISYIECIESQRETARICNDNVGVSKNVSKLVSTLMKLDFKHAVMILLFVYFLLSMFLLMYIDI